MYSMGNWEIHWLGHDGFRLTNGTSTIYIDPFQINEGPRADYILITHEHYDHLDPESIAKIKNINTPIFGPKSVTDKIDEMGITLEVGDQHETKDFKIIATAAYNTNKPFHPQEAGKIGYILELDGKRLYHAGDTDVIPEMAELGPVDVALLPVSGVYVMTADEAAEAVKMIRPKVAVPMHYGAIVGSVADANRFAEKAKDETEVVILEQE